MFEALKENVRYELKTDLDEASFPRKERQKERQKDGKEGRHI